MKYSMKGDINTNNMLKYHLFSDNRVELYSSIMAVKKMATLILSTVLIDH